jgi:DNA-binding GntR family transcriptional regulator
VPSSAPQRSARRTPARPGDPERSPAAGAAVGERQPAALKSAVEDVADQLRTRIKYGRLAPGQRLVEADLIEQLHVSRSTIRAAFSQLVTEGIVTIERNRGARVRILDLEGIRQLYEVRATLEGRAAGLVAERIDMPGCRAAIEALLEHNGRFSDRESFAEYWEFNEQLHRTIMERSGNELLRRMAEQARTLTYHYHLQAATAQSPAGAPVVSITHACDQHRVILNAILAGDGVAAEREMRDHIHANGDGIIRAFGAAP